jgi:hypothetical protein
MLRKLAICAVALWGVSLIGLTGCGSKEDNVELDSRQTVHPKTPQQIQAIENNPNIPPGLKARLLGSGGGPPNAKGKSKTQ